MQKNQELEKIEKNAHDCRTVAALNGVAMAACFAMALVNACANDYGYAITNVLVGALNTWCGVANYSFAKRDFRRICEIQQQMKKHQNGK